MRCLIFYLVRAQPPLNCPAILVLEYPSTGTESQLLTLGGPIYLLPQPEKAVAGQEERVLSLEPRSSHKISVLFRQALLR